MLNRLARLLDDHSAFPLVFLLLGNIAFYVSIASMLAHG
jgi:hypothetical protein